MEKQTTNGEDVKVTIVMPVFNSEKYLSSAIDGVLNQTFPEFELICVDDGSTDRSPEILKAYADADNRVRVLTQEHQNAGAARNLGMAQARGKYLLFLDADDLFKPELLETAYQSAEELQTDIFLFSADGWNEVLEKSIPQVHVCRTELMPKSPFSIQDCPDVIFEITSPVPWNKFFCREFIEENHLQFQSIHSANDMAFVFTALALAKRIAATDRILLTYRSHHASSLQNTLDANYSDFYLALRELKQRLQAHGVYAQVEKAYLAYAADDCLYNLNQMKTADGFEQTYFLIKHTVIPELGLLESGDRLPQPLQKELRVIAEESIFDYAADYQHCPGLMGRFFIQKDASPRCTVNAYEALIEDIYQSHSYRLGNRIVQPLHAFRKLLTGKI